MTTELKFLNIFNLTINSISFTISENIDLSATDLTVYVDNKKLSSDSFTVTKPNITNNTFVLKLSNERILHSIIFFINSAVYHSDVFIYFAKLNLMGDGLNQLSFLKFLIPTELRGGKYNLQGFKYNEDFISSSDYILNVYNGISSFSTIKKILSSDTEDIYEISLKDSSENSIPDGIYEIEIYFK
ncbi:MAG: hypothetical protein ACRC41_06725 [Sarcina sp.]